MDDKTKSGVKVIAATDDTPSIILDKRNLIIRIEGPSFPEDAVEFYSVVITWLRELNDDIDGELICDMDFTILSSASNKMIFEILIKLEKMYLSGKSIRVNWYYESFDEDMLDEGKSFKESMKMPVELLEK